MDYYTNKAFFKKIFKNIVANHKEKKHQII